MPKITRKYVSNKHIEKHRSEELRAKYLAEKAAIQQTDDYKRQEAERKITQEKSKKKDLEEKEQFLLLETSRNNLAYEMINDLKNELIKGVNDRQIVDLLIVKYSAQLVELRNMSEKVSNPNKLVTKNTSLYIGLWLKLVNENPLFLIHAPKEIFSNLSLPISKIKGEDRVELQTHLEEFNMFANKAFVNRYGKHFPKYIDRMNLDLSDPTPFHISLRHDPSGFERICTEYQNTLTEGRILLDTFNAVPDLFIYLSTEKQLILKDKLPAKVGKYLYDHPELLDTLPTTFFKRNELKYIFTHIAKSNLKLAFGERIKRHPALVEFLSVSKLETNYHTPDPKKKSTNIEPNI